MICKYNIKDKYKINNKGDLTFQFAAEILILMTIVMSILEFSMLGYRHAMAVNAVNSMSKTIAVQSGLGTSKPPNDFSFPRSTYTTISTFQSKARKVFMDNIKVRNYDINLVHKKGNGNIVSDYNIKNATGSVPNNAGRAFPYNDFFDLVVDYNIELVFAKNVIPGLPDAHGRIVTTNIFQYKNYYDATK